MHELRSWNPHERIMRNITRTVQKVRSTLLATIKDVDKMTGILLILSFVAPFSILYALDPPLFEATWIGRTFYLFFLWLVVLEMVLNWEKIQNSKLTKLTSPRTAIFITVLTTPTLYVVWANYLGLNDTIRTVAQQNSMTWEDALLMRIPIEYLVFTFLFVLMVTLAYGVRGLRNFSTSTLFLGIVGALYAIDTIYHNSFTPFQLLIPATTYLSASFLSLIGYSTTMGIASGGTYSLGATNANGNSYGVLIGWPCSGIESLLIYGVVTALFLRGIPIRTIYKAICFIAGSLITYFINILRVASFFVIHFSGGSDQAVYNFHNYYGPLYSVLWISSYPLIIMGIHALWARRTNKRNEQIQFDTASS